MQVRDLPLMQPSQTRLAWADRFNLGGRIGTLTRMDRHSFTIRHEMMLVTATRSVRKRNVSLVSWYHKLPPGDEFARILSIYWPRTWTGAFQIKARTVINREATKTLLHPPDLTRFHILSAWK
jgi:hypothetical protein